MDENINKRIKEKKIIIDPGIGFGKTLKHNIDFNFQNFFVS
jgi:Dihydropteroate synthase and related enzymes